MLDREVLCEMIAREKGTTAYLTRDVSGRARARVRCGRRPLNNSVFYMVSFREFASDTPKKEIFISIFMT